MRTIASCDVCLKVRNGVLHYNLSREGRGHALITICLLEEPK